MEARESEKDEKLNGRRRELLGNWKPDCGLSMKPMDGIPLSFPTRGSSETDYEAERSAMGPFEH